MIKLQQRNHSIPWGVPELEELFIVVKRGMAFVTQHQQIIGCGLPLVRG